MDSKDEPACLQHCKMEQRQKALLHRSLEHVLDQADAKRSLESCEEWMEKNWDSPNFARGVELSSRDDPRGRVTEKRVVGEAFRGFEQLPRGVRKKIIEIAIFEGVKEKVGRCKYWYGMCTLRELEEGHYGLLDVARNPMRRPEDEIWHKRLLRRGELAGGDCLGGLLGTNRGVREVVLRFLGERVVRGTNQGKRVGAFWRGREWDGVMQGRSCGWDVVVRSGKGQPGRTSNRRDVRRWRAAKYVFEGCWDGLDELERKDEGSVEECTPESKSEIVEAEAPPIWAIITSKNRLLKPERELIAETEIQTEDGENGSMRVCKHSKPNGAVETGTPIYASMTSSRGPLLSPLTNFPPAPTTRTAPDVGFSFFPRLPIEISVLIITHALHNSIDNLYPLRELLHHCNRSNAWRAKRFELLSPLACGGLLATSKLFRDETLQALQPYQIYGKSWSLSRPMLRKRDLHRWRSAVYMFDEPTVLSTMWLGWWSVCSWKNRCKRNERIPPGSEHRKRPETRELCGPGKTAETLMTLVRFADLPSELQLRIVKSAVGSEVGPSCGKHSNWWERVRWPVRNRVM